MTTSIHPTHIGYAGHLTCGQISIGVAPVVKGRIDWRIWWAVYWGVKRRVCDQIDRFGLGQLRRSA